MIMLAIVVGAMLLAEPQPSIATGRLPDARAIAALYMARNFLKEKVK